MKRNTISYKEMQANSQLPTYMQKEMMKKVEDDVRSRQRCSVCNNIIAPSNVNGDPAKCNRCSLK